jgi:hypothetical protein
VSVSRKKVAVAPESDMTVVEGVLRESVSEVTSVELHDKDDTLQTDMGSPNTPTSYLRLLHLEVAPPCGFSAVAAGT